MALTIAQAKKEMRNAYKALRDQVEKLIETDTTNVAWIDAMLKKLDELDASIKAEAKFAADKEKALVGPEALRLLHELRELRSSK